MVSGSKVSKGLLPVLLIFLMLAIMPGSLLVGCSQETPGPRPAVKTTDEKIQVVTTIYPLAEFARLTGGERAAVTQLLPQGAEPHHWEPSPQEIKKLYQAQVVIYNGAGLEPWIERLLPALRERKIRLVEAAQGLDLLTFAEEEKQGWTYYVNGSGSARDVKEHPEGAVDPHIWLDPELAGKIVSHITEEYIAADPAGKVDYLRNSQALQGRLEQLDQEYGAAVPNFRSREIVVSHAAFGYLARRYGLRQAPVLGVSPEQEPDAASLGRLVDYCRERDVRYIFYEPMVSPRIAETVAREVGAEILPLTPIGGLTKQDVERGHGYFESMQQNLVNLKKALGE